MGAYVQKLLLTDPSNYTNLQVGGGYINDNFAALFGAMSIDSTSYDVTLTSALTLNDGKLHAKNSTSNDRALEVEATNVSFIGVVQYINGHRAASSGYALARWYTSNYADLKFSFSSLGTGLCDGAWTGGGADRGEALRWYDDNSNNEDRMGMSVVFFNGRIYPADHADVVALEPTGIISATADSIGNASGLRWHGKYVIDDFGRKEFEPYSQIEWVEVVENGEDINHSYQLDKIPVGLIAPTDSITTSVDENGDQLMRQKLNPSYDPILTYVPRLERSEWDVMGMTGLVRMLKGQRTAPNWRKGDDISATVEEWLVK